MMSIYLAKLAVHHEQMNVRGPQMIGAASIYVALKICEQMHQKTILTKEILNDLLASVGTINEN